MYRLAAWAALFLVVGVCARSVVNEIIFGRERKVFICWINRSDQVAPVGGMGWGIRKHIEIFDVADKIDKLPNELGVLQRMANVAMVNDDRENRSDSGQRNTDNRQPLSKTFLTFIAVLLIAASGYLSRYAIKRDDYLYIVLVLLSFPPFAFGIILLFYEWTNLFWWHGL